MPCFRPLHGHRGLNGGISFNPKYGYVDLPMAVPCGSCLGCKKERARQWAVRLMHENQLHDASAFVTLTYNDAHLPPGGTLVKRDLQLFFKRLRKHYEKPIRYFACGEYGDQTNRPHYHAIVFNLSLDDRVRLAGSDNLYRSPRLEKLWPQGNSSFGSVSFASCSYVASYCVKKVSGKNAAAHYGARLPEFALMSRGGRQGKGLAHEWLLRFNADVYPSDEVISSGRPAKPPRFYDKHFERINPELHQETKRERLLKALEPQIQANSTTARLLVREAVATAKTNLYKGTL